MLLEIYDADYADTYDDLCVACAVYYSGIPFSEKWNLYRITETTLAILFIYEVVDIGFMSVLSY